MQLGLKPDRRCGPDSQDALTVKLALLEQFLAKQKLPRLVRANCCGRCHSRTDHRLF